MENDEEEKEEKEEEKQAYHGRREKEEENMSRNWLEAIGMSCIMCCEKKRKYNIENEEKGGRSYHFVDMTTSK